MSGFAAYESSEKMDDMSREMDDLNYNYKPMETTEEKYSTGMFAYDYKEIAKKVIKYLLEGIAVALVAYYFMSDKLGAKDIFVLGVSAAAAFAILDQFSPTVAMGARFGAGFGIGQGIISAAGASVAMPPVSY